MPSDKTLKIKYDGGDWNTIPGPSASLTVEGESIEDTILGQSWNSNWVGLLNWTVSGTAYFKGVAGYEAKIIKDLDELCARSFTLTQSADVVDASTLCKVQANNGYMVQQPGLRTVELSVSGFYEDMGLLDDLKDREVVTIKIQPAGAAGHSAEAEGDFIFLSDSLSGDVGAREEEELTFGLHVALDDLTPFTWSNLNVTTTDGPEMPQAIVDLINSFTARANVEMEYDNGEDKFTGNCFVTDLSLAAGTEGNVEFTVELASADQLTKTIE